MAQVTTQQAIHDFFEWGFPVAMEDWESLQEMATEWPEWDRGSRMDFLTDWPVVEDRTARLLGLEKTLPPGDPRRAKLRELRETVTRNRPILEYLMASVTGQ